MPKLLRQLGLRTGLKSSRSSSTADIANDEIGTDMLAAGEAVILEEVGGADLGGFFSARDLAARVYRAMDNLKKRRL